MGPYIYIYIYINIYIYVCIALGILSVTMSSKPRRVGGQRRSEHAPPVFPHAGYAPPFPGYGPTHSHAGLPPFPSYGPSHSHAGYGPPHAGYAPHAGYGPPHAGYAPPHDGPPHAGYAPPHAGPPHAGFRPQHAYPSHHAGFEPPRGSKAARPGEVIVDDSESDSDDDSEMSDVDGAPANIQDLILAYCFLIYEFIILTPQQSCEPKHVAISARLSTSGE